VYGDDVLCVRARASCFRAADDVIRCFVARLCRNAKFDAIATSLSLVPLPARQSVSQSVDQYTTNAASAAVLYRNLFSLSQGQLSRGLHKQGASTVYTFYEKCKENHRCRSKRRKRV